MTVHSQLRHVQDYDARTAAGPSDAAAAAAAEDDDVMSQHAVSLTGALLTARHLYILSRRINATLRHQLKPAFHLAASSKSNSHRPTRLDATV